MESVLKQVVFLQNWPAIPRGKQKQRSYVNNRLIVQPLRTNMQKFLRPFDLLFDDMFSPEISLVQPLLQNIEACDGQRD